MPAKPLQIAAAQLKFRRTLPENAEIIRGLIAKANGDPSSKSSSKIQVEYLTALICYL